MAKIYFSRGQSTNFFDSIPNANTLYFLEDTHEIYLGDKQFSSGTDVTVEIIGDGNIVNDAVWDKAHNTLILKRGNISKQDISSILKEAFVDFHEKLKEAFAAKDHTHPIDTELSETSENPLQNKAINRAISDLAESLNLKMPKIKFNTKEGWNSQSDLISESNTMYVYTDNSIDSSGNRIAGIKVGDGETYLIDLPIINQSVQISQEDIDRWNSKMRCYYSLTSPDTIVFTMD